MLPSEGVYGNEILVMPLFGLKVFNDSPFLKRIKIQIFAMAYKTLQAYFSGLTIHSIPSSPFRLFASLIPIYVHFLKHTMTFLSWIGADAGMFQLSSICVGELLLIFYIPLCSSLTPK